MIRPITPNDTEALMALAEALGLFSIDELAQLRQMVTGSLNPEGNPHPFWLVDDDDGNGLVGLVYCEPERMTKGTWNLQLIGVHPAHQQQGRGAKLLSVVEQTLAKWSARILLVETMGTPEFNHVQRFYLQNDYEEEARIREFYAMGADKVVFRKVLSVS